MAKWEQVRVNAKTKAELNRLKQRYGWSYNAAIGHLLDGLEKERERLRNDKRKLI